MEERKLNEKESLELISQMIRNTQQKLVRGNGAPFLIWGYVTITVSLTIWFLLGKTGDYRWNYLWFLIPLFGYPLMLFFTKERERRVKTYLDKVISYVWIAFGFAGFAVSIVAMFYWRLHLPILFIVVLLMSVGTAITGLIIQFKPIAFSGFAAIVLSPACLLLKGHDAILIFALMFLLMMVIPGHFLTYKNRKSNV